MIVSFFVPGIPAPGGSKKGFAFRRKDGGMGVSITDAGGQRTKDWRAAIALAASECFNLPSREAVGWHFAFVMPRPKSHYGTGKNAGRLKPDAPTLHTIAPDALKLSRSTEDALKGIAWADDAQVVDMRATKVYGERPGCQISIWADKLDGKVGA